MTSEPRPHPARFSSSILEYLQTQIPKRAKVLDPFAGVGTLFDCFPYGVGVEIEEEWACQSPNVIRGDSTQLTLLFPKQRFRYVATSPTYGNRMADHHEAKDTSKRHTYRHYLGRMPTEGSSSVMQWGDSYKYFHLTVWEEVWKVMQKNGKFFVNVKNHVRKNAIMDAESLHASLLEQVGFEIVHVEHIPVPGLRHGANSRLRVEEEAVFTAVKRV